MTSISSLGFIGVGALAEYTITGLRRGGFKGRILLSPRNHAMSRQLADDWQCEVMASNQAVVDNCDSFVLSTRPGDCLEALDELTLKPQKSLISVAAGVSIHSLRQLVPDGVNIVRAMPVSTAQVGASPTLVYPASPRVEALFDYCGNSIVADNESAFDQASVLACVYTWYFALFDSLIKANTNASVSAELSTELVLGMAKAAASMALATPHKSSGEIAEAIASDGTFSKLGLDILKQDKAFEPWHAACQALQQKIGG